MKTSLTLTLFPHENQLSMQEIRKRKIMYSRLLFLDKVVYECRSHWFRYYNTCIQNIFRCSKMYPKKSETFLFHCVATLLTWKSSFCLFKVLQKFYMTSGKYFSKCLFLLSSWFTWFCKPLYNSSQWAVPNPQSLREAVNSADDNTVSSAGSMWQGVYTTACLAKRIIFSSRAT